MKHLVAAGLLVIGVVLAVGGIVLAFTGVDGPEWVGKTLAIIVGSLITVVGSSQLGNRDDTP